MQLCKKLGTECCAVNLESKLPNLYFRGERKKNPPSESFEMLKIGRQCCELSPEAEP
jgi:hypothetical protein